MDLFRRRVEARCGGEAMTPIEAVFVILAGVSVTWLIWLAGWCDDLPLRRPHLAGGPGRDPG